MARPDIKHTKQDRPLSVGLVVYPRCFVSGLFAFAELLNAANRRMGAQVFEVRWVGVDGKAVPITVGTRASPMTLPVETTLEDPTLDALLLPGSWTNNKAELMAALKRQRPLVEALRRLPTERTVWGYCTAVCLLAEAGRLDGRSATSTWWLADHLQRTYPDVKWSFGQTSVFHKGDATASGVNGYLPVALSLIEQRCGPKALRDLVDLLVVPRPEAEQQPFAAFSLINIEDEVLREVVLWVEKTPASELSLGALARALHLTERTLSRRVRASTQYSAAQFMRFIKMRQASELLMYGSQPVYVISDTLGFAGDAAFRRTFKKVSSYAPSEYRRVFQRH